jgi:AAA+ ATPase superfamily predicted ATPase
VFHGLRVAPVVTLEEDGSLGFSFRADHTPEDLDATLEHLLELPAQLGADRDRGVALVFDEFQEIVKIDARLLPLMRSVFQEQPEVAHVYLGSKRHMMEQIFNDANEPFWRSAKKMELGVIPPPQFAEFIRGRFEATSRSIDDTVVEALLDVTHAHPYGTQELAYATWELTPRGSTATRARLSEGLGRVLRSENAHFSRIWDRASRAQRLVLEAFARAPSQPALSSAYRRAHNLPATSTVQRAIEALVADELIERHGDGYRIAEPFLAEWIIRTDL